jgi:hypothetical protein
LDILRVWGKAVCGVTAISLSAFLSCGLFSYVHTHVMAHLSRCGTTWGTATCTGSSTTRATDRSVGAHACWWLWLWLWLCLPTSPPLALCPSFFFSFRFCWLPAGQAGGGGRPPRLLALRRPTTPHGPALRWGGGGDGESTARVDLSGWQCCERLGLYSPERDFTQLHPQTPTTTTQMHRKLESWAQQYTVLLSSGLEEQRRRFEARLAELHAAYAPAPSESAGAAARGKKKAAALTGEQVKPSGAKTYIYIYIIYI